MATTDTVGVPFAASPEEVEKIKDLTHALAASESEPGIRYFLAHSGGQQIELPRSVFQVLVSAAREMAKGRSVVIVHYDHELTTNEAAGLLNVSRPFLIGLLEQGHIPYHKAGTHRRIRMRDLLEYKKRRDARRVEHLKEVQRVSDALGLYDDEC